MAYRANNGPRVPCLTSPFWQSFLLGPVGASRAYVSRQRQRFIKRQSASRWEGKVALRNHWTQRADSFLDSTDNKFWSLRGLEKENSFYLFVSLFNISNSTLTLNRNIPFKNRVKEKQGFLQHAPVMHSSFFHFVTWSFSHLWSNP